MTFSSGESVFAIIPLGFALTYCNSPIIVYEKNARTVCSFQSGEISLIAKIVNALAATKAPPTISRDQAAKATVSRLPVTVRANDNAAVGAAAQKQLSGSQPVVLTQVAQDSVSPDDMKKFTAGTTLVWKVNEVVVIGPEGFNLISGSLEIGSKATLYLAEGLPDGNVKSTTTMSVKVMPAGE